MAEDHLWGQEPDALSSLMFPLHPQTLMELCAQKPCPRNAHCLQTGASFQCLCLPGWSGLLCNIPLSSCQKAALSQGTNPRTNWGDEEEKGALLYPIPKGIHTWHLAKTTEKVEATQINHSDWILQLNTQGSMTQLSS